MKEFFEKHKIFIGVIIATLIIGGFIWWLVNKPPRCITEEWTNDICSGGTCEANLIHQIRIVTPIGCAPESRCIEDPICTTFPNVTVTKVIDGDTVVIEGGDHVRLLGIDADERDYPCYEEAKKRLEELILGKTVILERDQTDKDQYNRLLKWVFIGNQNINLQLVEEGQVICRFYEPDIKYKVECAALEKEAKDNERGCKWRSVCKCGSWVNEACGGGSCEAGLMLQTRICNPEVCGLESRCVENPICTISKCKWNSLTPEITGLPVVSACKAGGYLGLEATVEGTIVDTYKYSKAIFLNFERAYPKQCFTGVIWPSNWYKFPSNPEIYYKDKKVRISGEVREYEGRLEIFLEDSSQIEICQ